MMLALERGGLAGLDACVHCGFCLQACPTFLATGDEADSPRGRIELMRAFERGDLTATDPALAFHLDRCLGCRACEPVCPSGVRYGHGLETVRERLAVARGVPWLARAALWALTTAGVSGVVYALARVFRATGIPGLLAGWGRFRFALGMLAATRPARSAEWGVRSRTARFDPARRTPHPALLFRGCVMEGLFRQVHGATIRTLQVNGYEVREVAGQVCCGALHAHAGLGDDARALAEVNVAAFGDGDEPIVVNSAGCGAFMKDYGHVLDDSKGSPSPERRGGQGVRTDGEASTDNGVRTDGGASPNNGVRTDAKSSPPIPLSLRERGDAGARFAARVRDVTELLATNGGPLPGAPLDLHVAYDPPCHLLHAQRVAEPPQRLFAAIPLLRLVTVPGANDCCGSAGLFTLVEPEMSRAVLGPKIERLRAAAPQVVATGNPGCVMQLGAGLAAQGLRASVRHPVELLDASYRAAGRYE